MATLSALADRLRYEIGDIPKSFVYQTEATGDTDRYLIPYSPLDGVNLIVTVDAVDVSAGVEVEEQTGYITFDVTPVADASIVVAGTYYRYFTNTEVQQYVSTAFDQHSAYHTDAYGRTASVQTMASLEEYPVVIYASTLAMYALATDASFDIDITAPDGVMIPRSERYRQLMQMIEVRKNQYKELCSQLGIGLYKIDVFTLRRISKTTDHYVPIFKPKEIDDRSYKSRVYLPVPTYGNETVPSPVPTQDFSFIQGDSFEVTLDFPMNVSGYVFTANIVKTYGSSSTYTSFEITPDPLDNSKLILSLSPAVTSDLPERCYWDIQATIAGDPTYQQTYMRGTIFVTRQATI